MHEFRSRYGFTLVAIWVAIALTLLAVGQTATAGIVLVVGAIAYVWTDD